jgi:hypothetical protein
VRTAKRLQRGDPRATCTTAIMNMGLHERSHRDGAPLRKRGHDVRTVRRN